MGFPLGVPGTMDGSWKSQSKMDDLGVKRSGNSGRAHHCCALRNQSVVRLLVLTADYVVPCPIDSDGESAPQCLH